MYATIRIDQETHDLLQAWCATEERSPQDALRYALAEAERDPLVCPLPDDTAGATAWQVECWRATWYGRRRYLHRSKQATSEACQRADRVLGNPRLGPKVARIQATLPALGRLAQRQGYAQPSVYAALVLRRYLRRWHKRRPRWT